MYPANQYREDAGDRAYILIQKDKNIWPFADAIAKATHSPQLIKTRSVGLHLTTWAYPVTYMYQFSESL